MKFQQAVSVLDFARHVSMATAAIFDETRQIFLAQMIRHGHYTNPTKFHKIPKNHFRALSISSFKLSDWLSGERRPF